MKRKIPPAPKPTPVTKSGFPTMSYGEAFITIVVGVLGAMIVVGIFGTLLDNRLYGIERERMSCQQRASNHEEAKSCR